jgi:hypothetical protein
MVDLNLLKPTHHYIHYPNKLLNLVNDIVVVDNNNLHHHPIDLLKYIMVHHNYYEFVVIDVDLNDDLDKGVVGHNSYKN